MDFQDEHRIFKRLGSYRRERLRHVLYNLIEEQTWRTSPWPLAAVAVFTSVIVAVFIAAKPNPSATAQAFYTAFTVSMSVLVMAHTAILLQRKETLPLSPISHSRLALLCYGIAASGLSGALSRLSPVLSLVFIASISYIMVLANWIAASLFVMLLRGLRAPAMVL